MGRGQGFILAGASEEIRLVALFRTELGDIRATAPQIQKHQGLQKPIAISGECRGPFNTKPAPIAPAGGA